MISVVIPTYNEEQALPATLARLYEQEGDFEVIVVDGGSVDGTRSVAQTYPGIRFLAAPKGRAVQLNLGASAARGDWLLFLHADTLLPPGALDTIATLSSSVEAGGFRHRFSGRGWALRLVSWMDNLRCRSTRVIYGDQAMFVRRQLFHALGGFPPVSALEDVRFCEHLSRVTRPVLLDQPVVTDSRKFVQMGVWRSLARCTLILVCVKLGRPIPREGLGFFRDIR